MINVKSDDWVQIRSILDKDLKKNRLKLESVNCTVDEANRLRGAIHQINKLLKAVETTATN